MLTALELHASLRRANSAAVDRQAGTTVSEKSWQDAPARHGGKYQSPHKVQDTLCNGRTHSYHAEKLRTGHIVGFCPTSYGTFNTILRLLFALAKKKKGKRHRMVFFAAIRPKQYAKKRAHSRFPQKYCPLSLLTSAALMRSCGFLTSRRLMKFFALALIDDHPSW